MEIRFQIERNHGDLIVETGGDIHNFGYHSDLGFPLTLWLANIQMGKGNLFRGLRITKIPRSRFEKEDKDLVKNVLELGKRLPLGTEAFSRELQRFEGIGRFSNGTFSLDYDVKLDSEGLLYRVKEREKRTSSDWRDIFLINNNDFREVAMKYLTFSRRDEWLERYQGVIQRTIRRFRDLR